MLAKRQFDAIYFTWQGLPSNYLLTNIFIYTFVSGVLKLPSQGWGFQKQRSGSETSVSRTEEYPWWTRNGDISIFNKCLCLHMFVSVFTTVVMLLNASYALTAINGLQKSLPASHDLYSWKTYHLCFRQPWKQMPVELMKTGRPRFRLRWSLLRSKQKGNIKRPRWR